MRLLLVMVALAGMATSAAAQWFVSTDDNPFAKTVTQWVYTVTATGYGFGFRCEGAAVDEAKLLFITVEQASADSALMLTALKPTMAVIVDSGSRIDLEAEADLAPYGDATRLRFAASGARAIEIARSIAAAKKRVSVAVEVAGTIHHATNFSVGGSRKRIDGALAACGVSQPAS